MLRLLPLSAVLLTSLAMVARPWSEVPGPQAPAARPVVLMLHGRGLQGRDTASLRRAWTGALDEGIVDVAGAPLLREDDLRLVWYADALRPGSTAECAVDSTAGSQQGWAHDVGTTLEAAGTLMALAAEWLGGPEGAALEALAGDLLYLGDDASRCGAEERLLAALDAAVHEDRPIILVAHSFGALVAYHHLRGRDEPRPRIERFVTIGSLLGHPELRQILLTGGGGSGLPPGVVSWVNVRDPRDPFAAPLVGLEGDAGSGAIVDRVTERPHAGDPHDPIRYLRDPATARAVLEAWCDTGGGAATEPACQAAPSPGFPWNTS